MNRYKVIKGKVHDREFGFLSAKAIAERLNGALELDDINRYEVMRSKVAALLEAWDVWDSPGNPIAIGQMQSFVRLTQAIEELREETE